ncbi:MAG TPA: TonB-dependent receptor plug domain-containing protein, partial [Woeseiaceae bacterium]|nr:TonB-dependent receptor plug domain-containing protein [Woeseiaceae bacterium]
MPRIILVAIVILTTISATDRARGQENRPPAALEEITVTAQKREQSLQDVGIAVTAFTGEQIHDLGFTNTTDIVSMTPGLNYTVPNAESSQINFFLRGVGLNDFADANENPVAVYVDDVYRPAMGGLSFQLFDMERVEVLRGPQGTLFGRNTTGGLVHYVSRRPTDEPDGYLNATFGEFSEVKLEAAVGGPITDTLAGRLSLASNKNDGWTENRAGPDFNETDAKAARGQLLFTPTDDASLLLNTWWSDNDASVGAWQHQSTKFDADGESVPLGPNEQDMSVDCNADGMLDAADARPEPGTDCFGYKDTDG